MNIQELHKIFQKHPAVCTDSRKVIQGSIFFALNGKKFDANYFASDALDKGCSYAVVDNATVAKDERFILVENVLETLQNLAAYHRQRLGTRIMGITGTNGKTTTKELIKSVLETTYNVIATEGNLNNDIGVPMTLLRLQEETEIAIIEMGANHLHEIAFLCNIVRPNYGIITNIGKGHIEGFGSIDGVISTKTELYEAVKENDGTLFINTDDSLLTKEIKRFEGVQLYSYGTVQAQVTGKILSAASFLKLEIENTEIETQLVGMYNFENILAAYAIGKYFSVSKTNCIHAIYSYAPSDNRSQFLETKKNALVLDAYNANPSSMSKAIQNLSVMDYPNKFLILGDMLEQGKASKEEHLEIKKMLKEKGWAKQTWLVGEHFSESSEDTDFKYFDDVYAVNTYLQKHPLLNNLILIKGSRSVELEKVVQFL